MNLALNLSFHKGLEKEVCVFNNCSLSKLTVSWFDKQRSKDLN